MIAVNNELSLYDPTLLKKPQIVAVNKIDKPEVRDRAPQIEEEFKLAGIPVRFVSAATGEGVKELMNAAQETLKSVLEAASHEETQPEKVFHPKPADSGIAVHREDGVFIVDAPWLARMTSGTGEQTPELLEHVRRQLRRQGLDKLMRRAGAQPGDKVRCGFVIWEWWE